VSVTTTLPRLVGALALVAMLRLLPLMFGSGLPAGAVWIVVAALWLGAGVALLRGELVPVAAGLIAVLAVVSMPALPPPDAPDLALLAWMCLLLAVTDGRPHERSLLIRVCVSCVYGFTALAKMNPSFLAGEQLAMLAATRAQLGPLESLLTSRAGLALAVLTVAVEAWLAVGLWLRRTRRATATAGIVFHVVLVATATTGSVFGLLLLVVLNGLLLAGYVAFFDARPVTRASRSPEPVGD
jgi:hypothetical protein